MLPYALSIFTGAFLLFQVQPLIGKYILPWFGGGPGVWTTCLLFFQTVLLGGYAYAHFLSTRFKPQKQAIIHLTLLALSLCVLPVTPSDSWKTSVAGDPTWHILLLLLATIGLPYFVLSSTGPLMQQWFSYTNPGVSPYRLYALSNVGSLLALLSYPIYFEVQYARHTQATMWSVGLACFVLFCGFCAWRVWKHAKAAPATPVVPDKPPVLADDVSATEVSAKPAGVDKLLWVALPAIASILLLSTTNKLCQEVAVIPFLWVLPLSLYLLTFIISFDHARWYNRGVFSALVVIALAVVYQLMPVGNDAPMRLQIVGYTAALFIACMVCHGELYRLKPSPRYLTSYFLYISAGGALGGFLVAVVAPAIFSDYRELHVGLWLLSYALGVLCWRHRSLSMGYGVAIGALWLLVVLPWLRSYFDESPGFTGEFLAIWKKPFWRFGAIVGLVGLVLTMFDFRSRNVLRQWQPKQVAFLMILCVGFGAVVVQQWPHQGSTPILTATRNFYGTLKVFNYYPEDTEDNYRLLLHGATTHGLQFTKPERSVIPVSYYGENSGIGRAFEYMSEKPRRIGLVGLGTGTVAVFGRAGDTLRIYEINPAVEKIAKEHFTYLENSRAKIDIVMGDARLEMERELAEKKPQKFDLLALDAFSSDAIPVHLLTKEAFALYRDHMAEDGILAVHVSNRYLNLRPVVEKLAAEFGWSVAVVYDDEEPEWWLYATTWILVTKNKTFLSHPKILEVTQGPEDLGKKAPLWTDDYASLYSIMK